MAYSNAAFFQDQSLFNSVKLITRSVITHADLNHETSCVFYSYIELS